MEQCQSNKSMEDFKIKNYTNQSPNKKFPFYRQLSVEDMEFLRKKISFNFGFEDEDDGLRLVKFLEIKARLLENINADTKDFKLNKVFQQINISPQRNIYLDWYRFDKTDSMFWDDLCGYFNEIWYPGPDDISIFDQSLLWIVFVSHEGYISYLKKI